MYYISPYDTYDTWISDTEIFYDDQKKNCMKSDKKYTFGCKTEWVLNTCLELIEDEYEPNCPYFDTVIPLKCINGKWNFNLTTLKKFCHLNNLFKIIEIERTFHLYVAPIILLIYMTTYFHIYEYPEVMKDFKWKMITVMLRAKSVSLLIVEFFVVLNSAPLTKKFCTIFRFIIIVAMQFDYSTNLAVFLHTYSMAYNKNTQLRVIKSCLNHMVYAQPIIVTIISWLLDTNTIKSTSYFNCLSSQLITNMYYLEFTLYTTILVVSVYIYHQFKKTTDCITSDVNDSFRTEYDILGERREIPNREMFRCLYVLRTLLYLIGIDVGAYTLQLYVRRGFEGSVVMIVINVLFIYRSIISALLILGLIWFNKGFKARLDAWDLWYEELGRDEETKHHDKEFLKALAEIANLHLDSLLSYSQTGLSKRTFNTDSTETEDSNNKGMPNLP